MGLLLIVFFLALFVGFLLIFFIQKTTEKSTDSSRTIPEIPELVGVDFDHFYQQSCELLEKLGLVIKESSRVTDHEIDILAENPTPLIGSPVIVHLIHEPDDGIVRSMDVMNFSSNLVGDRKGKGLLITTGVFAPEIWNLPELPPMDFIDGKKFVELRKQYRIL